MVRLSDFDTAEQDYFVRTECPSFETTPWTTPKPLPQARVAIVSTAALQRRGEQPFYSGATHYGVIPGDVAAKDLLMSHSSVNFDRTGFQQDHNIAFPIDRLKEMATEGAIGGVADFHYTVYGGTPPEKLEPAAREIAGLLKRDAVDIALLVPV
ncbi:MAG: glycine/sarcosine/betaine reductase selenoprotein B family protein [Acetobacterales bacterium]